MPAHSIRVVGTSKYRSSGGHAFVDLTNPLDAGDAIRNLHGSTEIAGTTSIVVEMAKAPNPLTSTSNPVAASPTSSGHQPTKL